MKNMRIKRLQKGIYGLWAKMRYGYSFYFDLQKKMLIDILFKVSKLNDSFSKSI